jgi:hypothetical protein
MELKWLGIAWAVIMVAIVAGGAYDDKTRLDCRTAFAQSNKTVDEIKSICGSK